MRSRCRSTAGRGWISGVRCSRLTPLGRQNVAADDSVLGPFANLDGAGLRPDVSYGSLIRAAFQPAYWSSPAVVDAAGRVIVAAGQPSRPGEFTQMAYNFGLFFGLAVQAYESTLVSDDTPVDRFLAGDTGALTGVRAAGSQRVPQRRFTVHPVPSGAGALGGGYDDGLTRQRPRSARARVLPHRRQRDRRRPGRRRVGRVRLADLPRCARRAP